MDTDTIDVESNDGSETTWPEPEPKPATDPDAPFGRKKDGTPYKRDPARYRKRGLTGAAARSSKAKKAGDYRPVLGALLQTIAAPLAVLGSRDERFLADAAAIGIHGPGVVEAVNDIAADQPAVAAVLEKLAKVGPYGALLTALTPLVLQIAVNHDAIPTEVAAPLGVHSPADLIAHVKAEAEAEAKAAA